MRKFYIFSIFVVLSLVVGAGFAQAETITQTIPIKIEQQEQTLFDNFLQILKNNFFPQTLAETYSDTIGGTYQTKIFCQRAEGGWRTCENIFVQLRSNIKICTFGIEDADFNFTCNQDACTYAPKPHSFVCNYDLWKINKTILKTASLAEGIDDQDQCSMTTNILSGSSKIRLATPPDVRCIDTSGNTNTVIAEFGDLNKPSGLAQVWVQLRGKTFDGVGHWYGELTLEGTRPSMGGFSATADDYATGKPVKVGAGGTLNICKDESVRLKWTTLHTSDATVFVGSPQAVYHGTAGDKTFTPAVTTNIYIGASGYAGQEYKEFLFEDPISIVLHDCSGGPSPWVSIGANPNTINPGESSTLTWTSGNVTSCQAVGNASDWTGGKTKNGNATVTPSSTRWYEIKCTDGTTEVRDDAKVKVNGPPAGSLNVKIFLDGVEITNATDVSFDLLGSETINVSEAPKTISDVPAGTYNLGSVSGGPEESTFLNFTPTPTITVLANQTANLSLYFTSDQGRCNITVQATKYSCDATSSSPWTGALSYGLIGPIILNGTAVDQTFENIPAGRYYLTSLVGGPGIYNGVTPGNPISCPSGGNVTVMMKFKDCGDTTSYKCNYSTGRCDLCSTSSEECKYNDLPACNVQCSGCVGPHIPKANIFCWANFDSDKCVGVNDNNENTPSIILYDKSTDSCGDPRTCTWEIYEPTVSSGNMIKTIKTCAPYPWYDEKPGEYEAKLIVEDTKSSSFDIQPFEIKNVDALTCNFAWDPDAPTVSGTTGFFDQTLTPSGTTLKSWKWTFEGATPASSTAQTVSKVVFNSAGVKNVTLTVKNSADKTCTISKEITVKTINPYWKEVIPF
ncbi:MAG: hypothetical protein PHY54_19810 [Methylococcales bacterium]|nr:hypothetical protein [Methylococcales bacterium]